MSLDSNYGYNAVSREGIGSFIGSGSVLERPEEEGLGSPLPLTSPLENMMEEREAEEDIRPLRPGLPSRHSVQLPRGNYVSPLIASSGYSSYESTPDLRLSSIQHDTSNPRGVGLSTEIPGASGATAAGDEDDMRVEVGRKKEGVLWGAGSWEGVASKGGGKGKWERFWVVLDRSRIYEVSHVPVNKKGWDVLMVVVSR